MRISTRVALIALSRIRGSLSDFLYADFNRTAGLVFNGAAMPTDCDEASDFVESDDKPYDAGDDGSSSGFLYHHGHTATTDVFSTVRTIGHNSSGDDGIAIQEGVFGHRREFDVGSTTGCSTRLRLTPSHPSKAGSVWYESRVPVVSSFQVRDIVSNEDSRYRCYLRRPMRPTSRRRCS